MNGPGLLVTMNTMNVLSRGQGVDVTRVDGDALGGQWGRGGVLLQYHIMQLTGYLVTRVMQYSQCHEGQGQS